ncbi:MAG: hypothetical protein Rubg2KO_14010 [Rubricoccaceae bacterium]
MRSSDSRLSRRAFLKARRPVRPSANLSPYVPSEANPWNAIKVRHLLRRISLGARPEDVEALLGLSPTEAIDQILDSALARTDLADPSWIDRRKPPGSASGDEKDAFNRSNQDWLKQVYIDTINRLLGNEESDLHARLGESLMERLTVFWSNHFVTEYREYRFATWLFRYRKTLRTHALGNVRQLVHDIGKRAAMLRYLNGDKSRNGAPNENYARELLELFTMGITGPDGTANYTQTDITELARALTGWRLYPEREVEVFFDVIRHDGGNKTVFTRTEPFSYNDVAQLLFDERSPQIAHFIAGKLYREFVSLEPDPDVIDALAARLHAEDFVIEPVLRALLKSAHFFDAANIGALIKSPVEMMLGAAYAFGLESVSSEDYGRFRFQARDLDQDLFNPPDVKGWRDGQSWINTTTITERARRARSEVYRAQNAIIADVISRPTAYDAPALARELYTELLTRAPEDAEMDELVETLLAGTPEYAWDPTAGNGGRVRNYLLHLVSLPGFQLR